MRTRHLNLLLGVSATAMIFAGGTGAYGAEAPSPAQAAQSTTKLPEVVVTAQKRSEKLSDVPMSVASVSGDQLKERGIVTTGQLEKLVPGFTYAQSTYGAPIFTIRGIGFYEESVAISPTVSLYVDQIPIPFSRGAEAVGLDLERVEVLKGPQGTLFGQNSTGGAINYIAAKPTKDLAAGGSVDYGRFNDVNLQGYLTGPITDSFGVRVALQSERRYGWQQSTSRNASLGSRDFLAGRVLMDWAPTDTLKFELNLNGWKDRSENQAQQFERYVPGTPPQQLEATGASGLPVQALLAAFPRAPNNARAADWDPTFSLRRDDSYYQASLRGDWTLVPNITLTSISSYAHLDVDSPADYDGTPYPDTAVEIFAATSTFFQELRLAGTEGAGEKIHWMVGVNYQHDDTNDRFKLAIQGSNSGVGPYRWINFYNLNRQKIETKAAFASLDYKLTDTLTAQGSVRYTDQDRAFDGCLQDYGDGAMARAFSALSNALTHGAPNTGPNFAFLFPTPPGAPSYIPPGGCATLNSATNLPVSNVHKSLNENNTSWRAGLSWKAQPDVQVYGNVTKGFKAGSFATSLPALRPESVDPVPQESVLAYEVGFKSAFFDRTLQISGAGFYYDYKNKQELGIVNVPFFGYVPGLVTIPKSWVEGAELDARWRATRELTLSAGGAYVESSVTSNVTAPNPGILGSIESIKGQSFPLTPKWQFNVDGEYRFPVADIGDLYFGANVSYRSQTQGYFASGSDFTIPERTLLDLRAGLATADGRWNIQLYGQNVTNKYYWINVNHGLDAIVRTAGMPATYGVRISANF